jgi:hypothetical protein
VGLHTYFLKVIILLKVHPNKESILFILSSQTIQGTPL